MGYIIGVLIAAFILVVYVTVRYEYLQYNNEFEGTLFVGSLSALSWPVAILVLIAVGIGLIIKKKFKNSTGMKQ
jgi:Na+/serine symporter